MTIAPAAPALKVDVADVDLTHAWIGSATVSLTEKEAKRADLRHSIIAEQGRRIDMLEVYCSGCRRAFVDVVDKPCAAKINNEHLIGGDQRERVKRKGLRLPPGVEVTPIPAPRINRMGIAGILNGEA